MILKSLHYTNQNGEEVQDFEAVVENECQVWTERGLLFIKGDEPHWRLNFERGTTAVKLEDLMDQLRKLFPQEFKKLP